MGVAVTRTKVIVPNRRPDLLSRPRLQSLLDDILDFPLTLISAPAGYGKTSLMIDQAHDAPYPICWYTIDSLDKDPKRFLAHLVESLQIHFPDFGTATINLINASANPLEDPAKLVSVFVNELYHFTSEHFVIFLDDYHNLENSAEIHTFTSRFIQAMDDNIHLVIASRRLIHFPDLPLMIGRRMVKAIGFDDLSFSADEIRAYFQQIRGQQISFEDSRILEEKTEGWITGLLLSSGEDSFGGDNTEKLERVTGLDLFAYLAEQVFERQPPSIQGFLLRSSIFDEFNLDLCREILGGDENADWSSLITEVLKHNLFIQQVEDKGSWYRYHLLFQEFLRDRLRREFPEEEHELLSRQISYFITRKEWENAYRVSEQLQDHRASAEVIITASADLIKSGRYHLLKSWIEKLPSSIIDRNPYLLVLKGISCTISGDPYSGLIYLNQSIKELTNNNDYLKSIRALLCRATTNRIMGNYQDSIEDIKIIDHYNYPLCGTNISAEIKRENALAHLNKGFIEKAETLFTEALNEYIQLKDIENTALVQQDLALLYMDIGNYQLATKNIKLSLDAWLATQNKSNLSTLYNNLGALYLFQGKYNECNSALKEAQDYANQYFNNRIQGYIYASIGDLALSLLLHHQAISNYIDALNIAETTQDYYLYSYVSVHLASAYRYLKNFQDANEYLNAAKIFICQKEAPNELAMLNLEKGYLYYSNEEFEKAEQYFIKSLKYFDSNKKRLGSITSLLGLLLTSKEIGNDEEIEHQLKIIEDRLDCISNLTTIFPEIYNQKDILLKIIEKNIPGQNISAFIRSYKETIQNITILQKEIFPDFLQKKSDKPIYLQVNTFASSEVLLHGERITAPEWIHQRTVREVFFYLITHPEGISKEQLGLIFWPDSSPTQLTCQFKNAIYRLRRALGKDVILYDKTSRRYLFNRSIDYTYDAEQFTEAYQLAERESDPDLQAAAYQKASDIYRHPYGSDLDGVWAEPIRRMLFNKYCKSMLTIASIAYNNQLYQICLDNCFKLLDIEPCQEEASLLIMKSYNKQKKRIEAIKFYEELKQNLENNFELSPSTDVQSLYKLIAK